MGDYIGVTATTLAYQTSGQIGGCVGDLQRLYRRPYRQLHGNSCRRVAFDVSQHCTTVWQRQPHGNRDLPSLATSHHVTPKFAHAERCDGQLAGCHR